jgi:hypothetical protein
VWHGRSWPHAEWDDKTLVTHGVPEEVITDTGKQFTDGSAGRLGRDGKRVGSGIGPA